MSEETVFPPFRVSEAAVGQIVAVGGAVRIDITAGGCCGRTYVFTADTPDAGDEVFGCPGAVLAVSPVAVPVMTGAKLDYGAALKPPARCGPPPTASNRSRPSFVSHRMRALSIRVLALVPVTALAALALAACASSARLAPAACTPAKLRVTAAFSQGAGQHAIYDLRFTNVSRTACTLQGYLGVSLVTAGNSSGRPIGSPRPLIMQTPGPTVTLAPGERALALLGVAETVLFTSSSCTPVVAHWLKVYPSAARQAVYVPIEVDTCSSSSDQVLEIGSVSPDS